MLATRVRFGNLCKVNLDNQSPLCDIIGSAGIIQRRTAKTMKRIVTIGIALLAAVGIVCSSPGLSPLANNGNCWRQNTALASESDNATEKQAVEPAATDGETTLGPPVPEILSVEIYGDAGCTQPVQSLTPQTTYYAMVEIQMKMGNQLSHLREVRVTIFYDGAGTNPPPPLTGNAQTCGILICNIDRPPLWAIDAGSPTSWQILPAECRQPDLTKKRGIWIFAFKPGKVAVESLPPANWDVCARALTKLERRDELCIRNKAMNWYGEISFGATMLDWGEVQSGLRFENTPNPRSLTATCVANGNYGVDIKSDNWSGETSVMRLDESGGNPPPGEMQFALKISTTGNLGDAITIRKSYSPIGNGSRTGEGGVTSSHAFYLSLTESAIPSETYSGAISYLIGRRQ